MELFFGVGLRRGENGTAAGVSRVGAAWWEVDAKLFALAKDPKAAALAAIDAFAVPASVVVDSGGGYHGYHLLDGPYALTGVRERVRLEWLNRALNRAICGKGRTPDCVQDAPRVLRVPGTSNLKAAYGQPRPVRIVRWEPARRYTLAELEAVVQERFPWAWSVQTPPAATIRQVPVAAAGMDGLRERAERGRLRRSTLALLDSTGPAQYQSASEADAAIAAGLIGAGLLAHEAFALLVGSVRGRDALARKGERHGHAYLWRTVERASQYVGPVVERGPRLRVRFPGATGTPVRRSVAEVPAWVR